MKKLFSIALFSTLLTLVACSTKKTVTIRSENGIEYTAKVAPVMDDYISLSDTGRTIAIMKVEGFLSATGNEFIYNSNLWQPKDTISLGGMIRRNIVVGEVIDVR